jgi:hypothetical protein
MDALAGSFFNRHALRLAEADALGLLVRWRFQDLFHSPRRGAFHRSLAVLVRYRSMRVCCLGEWSPLLPTAFHGRRRTCDPLPLPLAPAPTGLSPSPVALSSRVRLACVLHSGGPVGPPGWSRNPQTTSATAHMHDPGLGILPVRSPLLGESIRLPRGTKMFQFPRFPPPGL